MEALELEKPTSKIKPQLIIPSDYIDLSQYDSIPALDRAIAEPDIGPFENMEDLINYVHEHWDDF